MYTDGQIYMGLADGQRVNMPLNMSNRHGLIAGASGTGKTITMRAMALFQTRECRYFCVM